MKRQVAPNDCCQHGIGLLRRSCPRGPPATGPAEGRGCPGLAAAASPAAGCAPDAAAAAALLTATARAPATAAPLRGATPPAVGPRPSRLPPRRRPHPHSLALRLPLHRRRQPAPPCRTGAPVSGGAGGNGHAGRAVGVWHSRRRARHGHLGPAQRPPAHPADPAGAGVGLRQAALAGPEGLAAAGGLGGQDAAGVGGVVRGGGGRCWQRPRR